MHKAPTVCLDLPYKFKPTYSKREKVGLRKREMTRKEIWEQMTPAEKTLCEFWRGYIGTVEFYEVIE